MTERRNTPPAAAPEAAYYPRIINPVRFSRAVVFAGDEDVRAAAAELAENMPWTRVEVARGPASLARGDDEEAAVFLFDDTGLVVADVDRLRSRGGDTVVVLLSLNDDVHISPPAVARERHPYTSRADLVFAADREDVPPRTIIGPAVRCAEDLLNIRSYSRERRFIFLIVDDEPRWFSQFLPALYGIIGQRADVMIARTFEKALECLFGVDRPSAIDRRNLASRGRGDDIICLITDLYFPRGDDPAGPAGRELVDLVQSAYPRIPIIVASKDRSADDLRGRALILPKGDPGSLQILKDYIQDHTGMGDFVLAAADGRETFRLGDLARMDEFLAEAAEPSKRGARLREALDRSAERDAFSTWFYMHGHARAAEILRPRQDRGLALVRELRRVIAAERALIRTTPFMIGGEPVFELPDLLEVLKRIETSRIQALSDNDVFSNWLEWKGFHGLAEELRPIHGSGERLRELLAGAVEKWIAFHRETGPPG